MLLTSTPKRPTAWTARVHPAGDDRAWPLHTALVLVLYCRQAGRESVRDVTCERAQPCTDSGNSMDSDPARRDTSAVADLSSWCSQPKRLMGRTAQHPPPCHTTEMPACGCTPPRSFPEPDPGWTCECPEPSPKRAGEISRHDPSAPLVSPCLTLSRLPWRADPVVRHALWGAAAHDDG